MKSTKPSDLRGLSENELNGQLAENERALVNMQFQKAVGQLNDTSGIRVIRRDIARIKTILREREMGLTR
jgi:large subunit ribosomal protein L29